jgi:hypothetical protein
MAETETMIEDADVTDTKWEGVVVSLHDAPIVLPDRPGVYMIRHTPTYKVYVGSSRSLLVRMQTHLHSLTMGTHYNHRLQSLFTSAGIDAFDVVIVHVFNADMPVEGLVAAEQKVIDDTKAWMAAYGFNVYRNADYRIRHRLSQPPPAIYLKGHKPKTK